MKSSSTDDLVAELLTLVDSDTIKAVQSTSKRRFLFEFTTEAAAQKIMTSGIAFRDMHLTLSVAYQHFKSVFVSRVPPGVPDEYFSKALSKYGRVVSVKSLSIKGFPNILSGTRLIRMTVTTPFPCFLPIMEFPSLVRYRGQPLQCFHCRKIGHYYRDCPIGNLIPSFQLSPTESVVPPSSIVSGSPPALRIVECRPDGVAPSTSTSLTSTSANNNLSAGSSSPPLSSTMDIDVVLSSCPITSLPGPVLRVSVGSQTEDYSPGSKSASLSLVDVETQTVTPPSSEATTQIFPPVSAICFSTSKVFNKDHVNIFREDLQNALFDADSKRGLTTVFWQKVSRTDSSIPWPDRKCGQTFPSGQCMISLHFDEYVFKDAGHLSVTAKK